MKKQTISLALALCLFGSTAQAGFIEGLKKGFGESSLGQLMGGNGGNGGGMEGLGTNFSNITSPQPLDGGYYGGSIEFRVDANSMVFQPWMDFKEPSVRMGCGSFTLDGGFIDLLGLEDIAEQLGNAAGAVVYGLLIALVNSMPSIEHVFSGIKRIIQQIQQMLGNMCQFGQGLGNKALSAGKAQPGWGLQSGIGSAQSFLNKGADWVEEKIKGGFDKYSATGLDKDQNKKDAETMLGGFFKLYDYTPLIAPGISKEKKAETVTHVDFTEVTIDPAKVTDNAQIIYLFAINIFGIPETMPKEFYDFLNANDGQGKKIPQWIAEGKLQGKDKEVEALKNLLAREGSAEIKGENTKANTNQDLFRNKRSEGPVKSPEKLIKELLNGGTNGQVELYGAKVLYGMAKAHTSTLTFASTINFDDKKPTKWKGLVTESLEVIGCRKKDKAAKCDNGSINLVVPGAMDMLNTIVTLEGMGENADYDLKQRDEFRNQAKDLEYILAKTNAYYCAEYFLEQLQAKKSEGVALVTGKGSMTDRDMVKTISILETYRKDLERDIMKKTQKLHEFKSPFEAADKKFKELKNKAASAKTKSETK